MMKNTLDRPIYNKIWTRGIFIGLAYFNPGSTLDGGIYCPTPNSKMLEITLNS